MTAADLRTTLGRLVAERHDAADLGLDLDAAYLSDLEDELSATRAAYVGLAVTEIAGLRSALGDANFG